MGIIDHLEKLSVLLAVRETGSLKRASETLRVTQPAVTRTVQTLEDVFGGALLRRTPKGVLFTPLGLAAVEMATELHDVVRRREPALASANPDISGRFLIGTFESIAIYFWPTVLRNLQLVLPGLEVSLQTGRSGDQMTALIDGKIDLAVTVDPPRRKGLEVVELFDDHLELFGSTTSDAAASTLILFADALRPHQETIEKCLRKVGLNPRRRIVTDSFEIVRAMTASGAGVGVLPTRVANARMPGPGLTRLCDGVMAQTTKHAICASYKSSTLEHPTLSAVLQVITDVR